MADQTVTLRLVGDASNLKRALDQVDQDLRQVVVQTDKLQATMGKGLSQAAGSATKRINQYSAATNRMMKSAGQQRAQMQNLGYQLQDVVVQLEMGTHWTRVFGQQGSQLLGIFGSPMLAILGAAGAAVLGLANAARQMGLFMSGAEREVAKFGEAAEKAAESTRSMEQELRALNLNVGPQELALMDSYAAALALVAERTESVRQAEESGDPLVADARLREAQEAADAALKELEAHRQILAQLKLASEEKNTGLNYVKETADNIKAWHEEYTRVQERAKEVTESAEAMKQSIEGIPTILEGSLGIAKSFADELWRGAQAFGTALNNAAAPNDFIRFLNTTGGVGGGKPGEGMTKDKMDKILQRGKYAPKTKNSSGGGMSEAERETRRLTEAWEKYDEAMADAAEAAELWGTTMENSFAQVATGGIDSFIDMLAQGKLEFKEFARQFLQDIAKMILRAAILTALMEAFGGKAGNPANAMERIVQTMSGISAVAIPDGPRPFAKGGIVGGPTLFPMSSGTGLMGEAGPEAIMPLKRGSDGNMGVAGPAISINNYAGADIAITRSDDEIIEIAVNRAADKVQGDFSRSMQTGQGSYARSMEQGYSARRRAT